jgi:hypothetical protein
MMLSLSLLRARSAHTPPAQQEIEARAELALARRLSKRGEAPIGDAAAQTRECPRPGASVASMATTLTSRADVTTEKPVPYMRQLCKHFGHKVDAGSSSSSAAATLRRWSTNNSCACRSPPKTPKATSACSASSAPTWSASAAATAWPSAGPSPPAPFYGRLAAASLSPAGRRSRAGSGRRRSDSRSRPCR